MKYLRWVILSLPIATILILWDHLPSELPIHSSGNGPDRFGSREDFGGLIVAITAIFALVSYIVLQIASSVQPISEKELNKAYLAIAASSSIMGFAVMITGLLSSK
jgi:hypothetical protein